MTAALDKVHNFSHLLAVLYLKIYIMFYVYLPDFRLNFLIPIFKEPGIIIHKIFPSTLNQHLLSFFSIC